MAGRRRAPVFTENFANSLDSIRLFLEPEAKGAFRHLLDRLFDDIVPMLCRHPASGRRFLSQPVRSLEAQALATRLAGMLARGDDLREFVVNDYLLLYLLRGDRFIFLAIKHHRQLSFDLDQFWP